MNAALHWTLRDIAPQDHEVLIALWTAAWTKVLPRINFLARQDFIKDRLNDFSHPPKRARLIEMHSTPIGFALIDVPNQELEQIAVSPDWQGSGAARALLDDARAITGQRLILSVNKDNPRAAAFYLRHGFKVTHDGVNPASGLAVQCMEWRTANGPGD